MSYKKHLPKNKRCGKRAGAAKKFVAKNAETYSGTVQASDKGFAFIIPDDKQRFKSDLFVPRHSVNGALDGDKVLFARVANTADEASIIKITKRANEQIIGTLQLGKREGIVAPDNPRLPKIYIPLSMLGGAKNNDKVVCEVSSYPKNKAPGGKIVEILGESGDFETEENAIIRSFNLSEEFPEDVLSECEKSASAEISTDGRRDLRDMLIFTIDGEDTRDIDDGVSLEIKDGNFVLGVHIADVSNYVKFLSATDKEAYNRGTSVYFPDRVLPMLPKTLSNGACSLNENEDKYALSCFMTFNAEGERISCEICKSVIRSKHRMTYSAVTAICEKDPDICRKYGDLVDTVNNMQRLCLALEKRREKAGSVSMEVMEAHIYVDENGEIVIPKSEQTVSQRIIEQFMISANEAVAEFLQSRKAACLYRIHESPAEEKAENFFAFLRDLGINVNLGKSDIKPKDYQNILKSAEDKPFYSVVNKVMLRSMQKARYSEENKGHFGLASSCYCHFTSPIRRYPDLFVHRVLKCILEGKAEKAEKFKEIAPENGSHCSERERLADEAERKVDDLYKLAYMSERLGEEYGATISGVTSHGIYCELDNSIEGLVPFEDLPPDRYEVFPEKFLIKGARHAFRLGDSVKIIVADYDLGRMKVLFALA